MTNDERLAIIRDNIKEKCDVVYSCEHDFNRAVEGVAYVVHIIGYLAHYNIANIVESILGFGKAPYICKLCFRMLEHRFDDEDKDINAMCRAALVCNENLDDFIVLGVKHHAYDPCGMFVINIAHHSPVRRYQHKDELVKLEDYCRIICNIMDRCY